MRSAKQMKDLETRLNNLTQAQQHFEGDILYEFQNHRNHDFKLPKKSFDGKTMIPPRGTFKGDGYFLMFIKSGDVRLINSQPYIRENLQESNMQKLILDQPEKVTVQGKTEQVVVEVPQQQQLNENPKKVANPAPDVLLVENPLDGIDIITN